MIDVGSAVGYLTLDTSGFTKGFSSAMKDMKTFDDQTASRADKLTALGSSLTSVGGNMTKAVTLPIMGAGVAFGKMASDFDDAMAKVSTIADNTAVPMDELKQSILELSNKTGIAATDIADNVYEAISSGQKTADAVAFVEKATTLAKAGFTSSAAATDVLTTALNAYGMSAEEVGRVSDVLITTQNLGKTTVDELASSMGKVIPMAQANGVSIEQLGAGYSILTSKGVATAESTTYMKSMFKELSDAGSDVAGILEQKTGKSFRELMEGGASLGEVLQVVKDYSAESGIEFSNLWSSVEAGSAAMSMTSAGVEGFNTTLEAMNNSTGITEEAYAKLETNSFKMQKAFNQLKNVGIDLGGVILDVVGPAIEGFANGVSGFADWFAEMPQGVKIFIVALGGLLAAIGPLLITVGKFLVFLPTLTTMLAAGGPLAGALAALTGPIGWVIAGVAALALAWATNFGGIRDTVASVFGAIQIIITTIWGAILEVWNGNLLGIRTAVENAWALIQGVFEVAFSIIKAVFDVFSAAFQGDWGLMWENIKTLLSTIWDGIKEVLGLALNFIIDLILGIGFKLYNAATTVFGKIKEGFSHTWDRIELWFKIAKEHPLEMLIAMGTSFLEAGKSMFTNLWDGAKEVWESIKTWVSEKIEWLKGKVQFWNSESATMDSSPRGGDARGSFASGLNYVPRDMNVRVHEGEAILTAEQNKNRTSSGGDTFIFQSPKALSETRAAQEFKRVKQELALGF